MSRLFIGTSGWVYKEWGEKFFPKKLPASKHLSYLATQFNSVEVNGSFYHLLPPTGYERWRKTTPKDFRFAVKVSRFITHIKRMKNVRAPWRRFLRTTIPLKTKQGPYLFQFPGSFTGKPEEVDRIDRFLSALRKDGGGLKLAFEFRHTGCFSPAMLDVLKKYKAALVFANSSQYPAAPFITPAPFVYFRLHGPKKMFGSSYSDRELKEWARRMRGFLKEGKDVYVYFNNDQHADAPANARTLQRFLKAFLPRPLPSTRRSA